MKTIYSCEGKMFDSLSAVANYAVRVYGYDSAVYNQSTESIQGVVGGKPRNVHHRVTRVKMYSNRDDFEKAKSCYSMVGEMNEFEKAYQKELCKEQDFDK